MTNAKKGNKKKDKKPTPVNYILSENEGNVVEEPYMAYGMPANSTIEILKYLGGKSAFKAIQGIHDFIALIRKGLTRKSLDHFMNTTGLTPDEMAAIMHTSTRTLRRYTPETVLNPEQSERVVELARLYSRGEVIFGSIDLFKDWMNTAVLALGNKKPKEFLDTSIGISILLDELGKIEHGIFA
jgi:putative toxin-antitoxin system antitoxin component (TIGR02293 family)